MTKISLQDVRSLAQLSALRLTDDEAERLTSDIEHILQYFEQLNELDTDGVPATYYGMDLVNSSRADEVSDTQLSRESLVELSEGGNIAGQVKVPKVL